MRKDVRNPDGVFHWNGREDDGQVAPDGTYYFQGLTDSSGPYGRPGRFGPDCQGQDRPTRTR